MSTSPALEALMKKKQVDVYETETDLKITEADNLEFCSKHNKAKKNGRCIVCDMEEKHELEMKRRNEAVLDGTEQWIDKTCFKKERQTKKYVKKMMGLTGKQYRKLNIKARRNEQNRTTVRKPR